MQKKKKRRKEKPDSPHGTVKHSIEQSRSKLVGKKVNHLAVKQPSPQNGDFWSLLVFGCGEYLIWAYLMTQLSIDFSLPMTRTWMHVIGYTLNWLSITQTVRLKS